MSPQKPTRPSDKSAANTKKQQALKDKARQNANSGDDEDEEGFEEEESWAREMLRQSPSWLTSMVVHMILLLVLALWALEEEIKEVVREITLAKTEVIEEDEIEEEEEEVNEELDPEIVSDVEQEIEEVVSPIDFEESPIPLMPADADDPTLAAPKIEYLPNATETAAQGTLLSKFAGLSKSGLGSRTGAGRSAAVRRGGGGGGTESAVELALKWLSEHQNRDGSWSYVWTEGDNCSGFPNQGEKETKMGATGMALLPFLGAGYTHTDDNKYQYVVRKGLKYLVGNMHVSNNAGRLYDTMEDTHSHMYAHGIAACAVAEAYGMTQDDKLKAPAQLAVNYIVNAQHPDSGGWLYTPLQGGDTSVVGWQIMALKSAILSYLVVPGNVKSRASKWLDFVGSDKPPGGYGIASRYGYRNAKDRHSHQSGATTAIGLLCRNYLGTKKDDEGLRMGVQWISGKGFQNSDMYYNYHASMVMFQNDGPDGDLWKKWNEKMKRTLIGSQEKNGKQAGSWHFAGNHGKTGGRVYNTCLSAMTLEVYYRYLPVYQKGNVEQDDFPLE